MEGVGIVIQAGGESTRMGKDKALIPIQGMPMIEYIIRQIEDLGDELIIITNEPENYQQFGLPTYSDVIPNWGALGGLYSAIFHSSKEVCLILACDMPFVNRSLMEYIISLSPGYDAVIPRLDKQFSEPFRAVYRKSCLEPIKSSIEAGKRRVNSFFDQVDIRFVDGEEIAKFDPDAITFFNVNTPEELVEAERIAHSKWQ